MNFDIFGVRSRLNRRGYIDQILGSANPKAALYERIEWLVELLKWVRAPIRKDGKIEGLSESGPLARVRFVLQFLRRHEEVRERVALTIRSILDDMDAVDLFASAGIPFTHGFIYELSDRITAKFLPTPMRDSDLGQIFFNIFPEPEDILWLSKLDEETIEQIATILVPQTAGDVLSIWLKLGQDIKDAMVYLAVQIQAHTLSPDFRMRLPSPKLRESSFYYLEGVIKSYLEILTRVPVQHDLFLEKYRALSEHIGKGLIEVEHVRGALDKYGANLNITFSCDRVERQLSRIQKLADMASSKKFTRDRHLQFFITLIEGSAESRSIRNLINEGLQLLSKRITERNAELGELYISRDWYNFRKIFKKAAGGGMLTALTATIKIYIDSVAKAPFLAGALVSINYALSFTLIQLAHFTLATKQPAMTATALSSKLAKVRSEDDEKEFVDETIHLVRTQFVSVLGNLLTVVPTIFLFVCAVQSISSEPLMDPAYAWEVIEKHSVLGMTPLYGAFTGLLLWISSLCAGIVDNWASFRQLREGIAQNLSLIAVFGKTRTRKFADFFHENIGGVGGNVSLGFLLGLAPKIISGLGIPADVRHVTLASGLITFAVTSIGISALQSKQLIMAVLGILVVGVLNISVSFGLALWTAVRSLDISRNMRRRIYRKVFLQGLKKPWQLIFPSFSAKAL
jgi:site-specific recombinase